MQPLGMAIVGCGGAAVDVAQAIDALPGVSLVAAHDRDESRAAALAGPRGGTSYPVLADLLSDEAVDVVYVALPHHLLASTATLALMAGKHALVEKPMALDEPAIASLRQLAYERQLRLGVFFELREAGPFRAARRLIESGAIGDISAVRIRTIIDKPMAYWQSGPRGTVPDGWRSRRADAGGGVVLMNSIHQLDVVRYLTGLSFVRALAETATLTAAVEVEDCAAAVLRLSNGALVSVVASAHSPGATRDERIEIDGAHGRLDLPDPHGPGSIRLFLRRPWREFAAGEWIPVDAPPVDCHLQLLRGFLDAVRTGTAPPASAADAAAALATVLAIYRSAGTGRAAEIAAPGHRAD